MQKPNVMYMNERLYKCNFKTKLIIDFFYNIIILFIKSPCFSHLKSKENSQFVVFEIAWTRDDIRKFQ